MRQLCDERWKRLGRRRNRARKTIAFHHMCVRARAWYGINGTQGIKYTCMNLCASLHPFLPPTHYKLVNILRNKNKKVKKSHNENFIVVLFYPNLLLYRLQLLTYATRRFQASLNTLTATYWSCYSKWVDTRAHTNTGLCVVRVCVTIRFDLNEKPLSVFEKWNTWQKCRRIPP